jgi:hypothetical protein
MLASWDPARLLSLMLLACATAHAASNAIGTALRTVHAWPRGTNASPGNCLYIYMPGDSGGLKTDLAMYAAVFATTQNNTLAGVDLYLEQSPASGWYKTRLERPGHWWSPNLEFTSEVQFPNVTLIIAKTALALERLLEYRPRAPKHFWIYHSGHTSPDLQLPAVNPDYTQFIIISGSSPYKNTRKIIEAWLRHPEWPKLTVVTSISEQGAGTANATNIHFIGKRVTVHDLARHANAAGIHLCLSLLEGFGHPGRAAVGLLRVSPD